MPESAFSTLPMHQVKHTDTCCHWHGALAPQPLKTQLKCDYSPTCQP
jgi:hypothetical protein